MYEYVLSHYLKSRVGYVECSTVYLYIFSVWWISKN